MWEGGLENYASLLRVKEMEWLTTLTMFVMEMLPAV